MDIGRPTELGHGVEWGVETGRQEVWAKETMREEAKGGSGKEKERE